QRESDVRRRHQQLPGALHHPPLLDGAGRPQGAQVQHLRRSARRRRSHADRGEGAGDGAARKGRAEERGSLGGAGARDRRARRRHAAEDVEVTTQRGGTMSAVRYLVAAVVSCAVVAAAPGRAQAFCGFFVAGSNAKLTNNASQVVLMRKGNRTVMTMSNTYQGPPENFAM